MEISEEAQRLPPGQARPLSSVRTLLIWLALACFLPALIGGVFLVSREYQNGRAALRKNTLQTARALVQTIDAQLLQAEQVAQTLATSDSLARQDFAAFYRQARASLLKSSFAQSVLIYDGNGQQLLNTRLPFGQPLPQRTDLTQIARVFASGQPVTSEVVVSPLSGLPVISIAVPVFSGAKVVYALAIGIAPQQFNSILSRQRLPADWVVGVLDPKGTLAARTHAPETFVGKQGSPPLLQRLQQRAEGIDEITTSEGISTLAAYSRSPDSGWSVAVGIPSQSLEAQLRHTLLLIGVGAALLLGLSLGLAWLVGGRITRSMRALRSAAIDLGAGKPVLLPQVILHEADEVARAMASAAGLLTTNRRALMAREAELADAQRIARIGNWSWDARTDATVASPEMCRIFGRPVIPPFALQDGVMFPHEAWLALHQARQQVIQTGVGYNMELPALDADGRQFWVNSRSEVVRDSAGEVVGLRGMVQDITERKQAESIAKSERFIRTITDAMPGLVAYWDKDLCCRFANQAYLEWFGRAPEKIIGGTMMELIGGALFALNESHIRATLAGEKQQFERALTKIDGSLSHTLVNYIPDIDGHGIVAGFYVLITDVTPLKKAEAELQLSSAVYQHTAEAIMVTDFNGIILSVNPAFTRITGYPAQEAIGQTPRLLRSNHHEPEFHAGVWRQINETGQWQGEVWNRRKSGEIFPGWQTITRIAGSGSEAGRYVSVFHDITDTWHKNESIRHLAFHDALTLLPNRALLIERLERQIALAEREPRCLAVLFLDLDRFKVVNDTLGHAVGDDLLIAVAQKLQALVRQTDTVARFGGDEFVILLDNPANQDEVVHIATRIIAVVNEPMEFGGKVVNVGTSIGIALFPADGISAAELLKSADTAMYEAKHAGRNTYRFFVVQVG